MYDTAQEMYKDVKKVFDKTHLMLQEMTERARGEHRVEEHADLSFAMRECAKFLDDMRKECNRLSELSQKIGSVIWVKNATNERIRTEYCTTEVDIQVLAAIPKEGTAEHQLLMDHLGVPREVYHADYEAGKKGAVRIFFPALVDHLSERAAAGLPLPPGIDLSKTYNKYRFYRLRKRKDVDAG